MRKIKEGYSDKTITHCPWCYRKLKKPIPPMTEAERRMNEIDMYLLISTVWRDGKNE